MISLVTLTPFDFRVKTFMMGFASGKNHKVCNGMQVQIKFHRGVKIQS